MAKQITHANFTQEVLNSELPVLVDFWAPWCGPCKMMGPIVAELEADMAGKLVVGKVNVDDEPALAAQFGIMNIPTVVLFRNGKEAGRSIGLVPKQRLMSLL